MFLRTWGSPSLRIYFARTFLTSNLCFDRTVSFRFFSSMIVSVCFKQPLRLSSLRSEAETLRKQRTARHNSWVLVLSLMKIETILLALSRKSWKPCSLATSLLRVFFFDSSFLNPSYSSSSSISSSSSSSSWFSSWGLNTQINVLTGGAPPEPPAHPGGYRPPDTLGP